MSEDNERWLTDGNCSKCRRKKYCSKPCSANQRKFKRDVYHAMDSATGGMLSYVMSRGMR